MEVRVLDTSVIHNESVEILEEVLSTEEKSRANRFFHKRDRCNFIFAHWLKRKMIADFVGTDELHKLNFDRDRNGKPFFIEGGIYFNLSHSNRAIACAINMDNECGVDVESYRNIEELSLLLKSTMTDEERKVINSSGKKCNDFLDRWVIKEALLKTNGKGLSEGVDGICTVSECKYVRGRVSMISDHYVYQYKNSSYTLAVSSKAMTGVNVKEINLEVFKRT